MSYHFELLQEFLEHLTSWRMPGNAVVVYHHGKEVFSGASGWADVEKRIPMDPDHFVNIYSCSKVATVTAALQLYEQGKFLLYEPLSDFMPEYKDMTVRGEDGEIRKAHNTITIRDLFTMTAGFDYNFDTPGFHEAYEKTEGHMDTVETFRCVAKDPLAYEPGTRWMYSKGHDLLAAFVEVVSGERFCDYVRRHIFEPLDIEGYYHFPHEKLDLMAQQYRFVEKDAENSSFSAQDLVDRQMAAHSDDGYWQIVGKEVATHRRGDRYDSGGAGVSVRISDYAKFCNALAMKGLGATGERILSPGTVELLQTNQLKPELIPNMTWSQLTGYGYGLGVRTVYDRALAGFTGRRNEFGWGGAAGATVMVDSDDEISCFYAHHMLNPQEGYYQPRLRNVIYTCMR